MENKEGLLTINVLHPNNEFNFDLTFKCFLRGIDDDNKKELIAICYNHE